MPDNAASQHRTQFDEQLPYRDIDGSTLVLANRNCLTLPDGSTLTALAWCGDTPMLRLWRDRTLLAKIPLEGEPGASCLVGQDEASARLWLSVSGVIYTSPIAKLQLQRVAGLRGTLHDVTTDAAGHTVMALTYEGRVTLASIRNSSIDTIAVDDDAGRPCLEVDGAGRVHLAYEKRQGIEYRRYDDGTAAVTERAAEAFGFHPALLVAGDQVLLAYRGESCRLPSYKRWGDAWERLGRGGYIGALVRATDGRWRRFRLADSKQIVKPWRPIDTAYGGGPEVEMRVRLEMFSPPTLTLGPDGVPHVLWADTERRWAYAARWLQDQFTPAVELRGPLEQLTTCLTPRRVPPSFDGLPVVMVTKTRSYQDSIALPRRRVDENRRIDFVQSDMLAQAQGVETALNSMRRHHANPILRHGTAGAADDGGVLADVYRDGEKWRAELCYVNVLPPSDTHKSPHGSTWHHDGRAVSDDGVHWTKLDPLPLAQRYSVDGGTEHIYSIRFLRDDDEPDAAWRYKGLWRTEDAGPWGWVAVVSPDGEQWTRVRDGDAVLAADDDLRIWGDVWDVPARRFKASSISRSYCGRVCCQWVSADGVHWRDQRETLDFDDPFGAKPDRGTTGRILLDSWAGPDDEDEVHGGFVFRDGERWLLHYMKWTQDGHIYLALASSRDGINFSRVAGGRSTLPLGESGTWDAGRVAIREAPFLVDEVWRQFYTGCGWKHGLGGIGARTSHVGINAPNQTGIAEIPTGRWAHLQVTREADAGSIRTIPFEMRRMCDLTLDVDGLERAGSEIACALCDGQMGAPLDGYSYDDCDSLDASGQAVPVTWRGKGWRELEGRHIAIGVRLRGHGLKLFGMELKCAD